jgi:hypothetical protein
LTRRGHGVDSVTWAERSPDAYTHIPRSGSRLQARLANRRCPPTSSPQDGPPGASGPRPVMTHGCPALVLADQRSAVLRTSHHLPPRGFLHTRPLGPDVPSPRRVHPERPSLSCGSHVLTRLLLERRFGAWGSGAYVCYTLSRERRQPVGRDNPSPPSTGRLAHV